MRNRILELEPPGSPGRSPLIRKKREFSRSNFDIYCELLWRGNVTGKQFGNLLLEFVGIWCLGFGILAPLHPLPIASTLPPEVWSCSTNSIFMAL